MTRSSRGTVFVDLADDGLHLFAVRLAEVGLDDVDFSKLTSRSSSATLVPASTLTVPITGLSAPLGSYDTAV